MAFNTDLHRLNQEQAAMILQQVMQQQAMQAGPNWAGSLQQQLMGTTLDTNPNRIDPLINAVPQTRPDESMAVDPTGGRSAGLLAAAPAPLGTDGGASRRMGLSGPLNITPPPAPTAPVLGAGIPPVPQLSAPPPAPSPVPNWTTPGGGGVPGAVPPQLPYPPSPVAPPPLQIPYKPDLPLPSLPDARVQSLGGTNLPPMNPTGVPATPFQGAMGTARAMGGRAADMAKDAAKFAGRLAGPAATAGSIFSILRDMGVLPDAPPMMGSSPYLDQWIGDRQPVQPPTEDYIRQLGRQVMDQAAEASIGYPPAQPESYFYEPPMLRMSEARLAPGPQGSLGFASGPQGSLGFASGPQGSAPPPAGGFPAAPPGSYFNEAQNALSEENLSKIVNQNLFPDVAASGSGPQGSLGGAPPGDLSMIWAPDFEAIARQQSQFDLANANPILAALMGGGGSGAPAGRSTLANAVIAQALGLPANALSGASEESLRAQQLALAASEALSNANFRREDLKLKQDEANLSRNRLADEMLAKRMVDATKSYDDKMSANIQRGLDQEQAASSTWAQMSAGEKADILQSAAKGAWSRPLPPQAAAALGPSGGPPQKTGSPNFQNVQNTVLSKLVPAAPTTGAAGIAIGDSKDYVKMLLSLSDDELFRALAHYANAPGGLAAVAKGIKEEARSGNMLTEIGDFAEGVWKGLTPSRMPNTHYSMAHELANRLEFLARQKGQAGQAAQKARSQ